MPSSLRSTIHSGPVKRSWVRVAAIGTTHSGKSLMVRRRTASLVLPFGWLGLIAGFAAGGADRLEEAPRIARIARRRMDDRDQLEDVVSVDEGAQHRGVTVLADVVDEHLVHRAPALGALRPRTGLACPQDLLLGLLAHLFARRAVERADVEGAQKKATRVHLGAEIVEGR